MSAVGARFTRQGRTDLGFIIAVLPGHRGDMRELTGALVAERH
jgi:hypothetical protein